MHLRSTIARGNTNFALPSPAWQMFAASGAMLTAPFLGTQPVYVAIKQVVTLCSEIPFKFSIARPPERVRVCAGSTAEKAGFSKWHSFFLLLDQENLS